MVQILFRQSEEHSSEPVLRLTNRLNARAVNPLTPSFVITTTTVSPNPDTCARPARGIFCSFDWSFGCMDSIGINPDLVRFLLCRYWTRGGTLRNVPVGGGCRKNKRVKRSSSSFITATAANTTTVTAMVSDPNLFPNHVSTLSLPPTYSSCAMDPIFYGNSTGIDFPTTYPSSFLKKLNHTTVNSYNPINSNLTSMGLCFPINAALPTHQDCMTHPPNHLQFQQTDSSNSLFHDFSLLGTSSFTTLRHPKTSINSTGWSANDRNIQAPVASGASDLRNFDGVKEEEEGRSIGVLDWQIQYDGDLFQNLNAVEGNSLYWNVNPLSGISNTWPELPTAATANHSVI